MSHASKFDMVFKDKRILFKAMKKLDLRPENRCWGVIPGTNIFIINLPDLGKLLTGFHNDMHIFFIEENGMFVSHIESHGLTEEERIRQGGELLRKLQGEYLKCALEKMESDVVASGQSARIIEEFSETASVYILEIGDAGKKLVVSLGKDGVIQENVIGVAGRSCVDLVLAFESQIAQSVERSWTHEYDEVIEDQVVQVLSLQR